MPEMNEELLINRMVQGEAAAADWGVLAGLAEANPGVWSQLAAAQRDQAALSAAVQGAIRSADEIELPAHATQTIQLAPARQQGWRIASWSGWGLAAMIALAWSIGQFRAAPPEPSNESPATHLVAQKPSLDDAPLDAVLTSYLNRGKQAGVVLGELPEKVLLNAQPLPDGQGYELLYLRQLLERTRVPDLYEFGAQDETGLPTLIEYDQTPGQPL